MRVVLAGQGAMGSALADGLAESDHELVGLLVQKRRWLGIGDALQRRARGLRIPVVQLGEPWSLAALKPDLLLCGDFGSILGTEWLEIPTIGGINAHWSLLPRHRGPDPAASVILAGDRESGLTFHVLTKRIDGGAILDQTRFSVGERDTTARVYHQASRLAAERLGPVLDAVASDGLTGQPQDLTQGSYRRRLTEAETAVHWNATAAEIDRLVRACTRPMAHFVYKGQTIFLSACTPVEGSGTPGEVLAADPLVIATGAGALRIERALTLMPPFTWPGWPTLRRGASVL